MAGQLAAQKPAQLISPKDNPSSKEKREKLQQNEQMDQKQEIRKKIKDELTKKEKIIYAITGDEEKKRLNNVTEMIAKASTIKSIKNFRPSTHLPEYRIDKQYILDTPYNFKDEKLQPHKVSSETIKYFQEKMKALSVPYPDPVKDKQDLPEEYLQFGLEIPIYFVQEKQGEKKKIFFLKKDPEQNISLPRALKMQSTAQGLQAATSGSPAVAAPPPAVLKASLLKSLQQMVHRKIKGSPPPPAPRAGGGKKKTKTHKRKCI
jgi:hypothetical protein